MARSSQPFSYCENYDDYDTNENRKRLIGKLKKNLIIMNEGEKQFYKNKSIEKPVKSSNNTKNV